jgi:putative N6-adenine-specific DNA methylase
MRDVCTLSVDTSGALLHLRGYRQQLAKAPLRETLAAAVLLGADWSGDTPLVDPMCGSGTIPIEGALMARRIAPGIKRTFAFLRWPETDPRMWVNLVTEARAAQLDRSPVEIAGSDRDEGAIVAARANAERAGVAADVTFTAQPISALARAEPPGLIAANPPYGVRVGETEGLRNLYAQLGNVARRNRPGWTVAMLSADRKLERQVGLPFESRLRTQNGGIPVHLVVTPAPAAVVTPPEAAPPA